MCRGNICQENRCFTYKYYIVGNVPKAVSYVKPATPFNNGKAYLDKTWIETWYFWPTLCLGTIRVIITPLIKRIKREGNKQLI